MIRSFLNADLPSLHQLWVEHWSRIAPAPLVREAQIEQAVLARTFFQADRLLVAERDGVPCGWLHFSPSPLDQDLVVIPTICVGASEGLATAESLLEEAGRRISQTPASRVQVGVVRDDYFGYAGLEPFGQGIGVWEHDTTLCRALQNTGYQVTGRSVAMSVSVVGFRPPMNREALQYRRATQMECSAIRYQEPRRAAGVSHLDLELHRLVDRSGECLGEVTTCWSDPEAEVMRPTLMLLDIGEAHQRGRLDAAESYLIGAVIQLAAQRKVVSVETAVDENRPELLVQLQSLSFRPSRQGACWVRQL